MGDNNMLHLPPRIFSESAMNKSKESLENWCSQVGWTCTRIPEGAERTPDYILEIDKINIYAEVKEIVANEEEIKVIKQLEERGWGDPCGEKPGKTVREKIKASYEQIKRLSERDKTCAILVLYNNSGMPGLGRLDHYHVLTAMFGLQTLPVIVPSDPNIPLSFGLDFFGPKKSVSPKRHRYLSGILTLYDHHQKGLLAFFYHNPHALVPLHCRLIDSENCIQYRVSPTEINWEFIKCAEG